MSNLFPASFAEPLASRTVRLGELEVHRLLPVRGRRMIGPYCFLDRFGPLTFQGEKVMDVAPHPHIGLQTVTWLFSGEIVHHDSLGSECLVRPGHVSMMTSGRGIAHTEETPPKNSGHLDGVQLWVALPDTARHRDPQYECFTPPDRSETRGGRVTTILGHSSPGSQSSPGIAVDLEVQANQELAWPLDPSYEYGLMLASGDATALGVTLIPNRLYHLSPANGELGLASRTGARLLLLGGPPFGETILMWWNFVARTSEEIRLARQAWENHERFGDVASYRGARIPAPVFEGRPIPSPSE